MAGRIETVIKELKELIEEGTYLLQDGSVEEREYHSDKISNYLFVLEDLGSSAGIEMMSDCVKDLNLKGRELSLLIEDAKELGAKLDPDGGINPDL